MSVAENNLLVVDPDDDFVSRAKELFDGRLPVARTIEEAPSPVESGAVRLILLGPSFHTEAHMDQIRSLHNANPAVERMQVADEATADLVRGGLLAGDPDRIVAPLDGERLAAPLEQFA